MKKIGDLLGIQLTETTGYNAKSNSTVERAHSDLAKCQRALCKDDPDSWEDVLPRALFAMRTAVNKTAL